MAKEMGLNKSIHYYMPQKASPPAYAFATNKKLRSNLKEIFKRSESNKTVINLQTHSWSGYVATTSCGLNRCDYVNHISYNPATIPRNWPMMSQAYSRWAGRGHVSYSNKDFLSNITFKNTRQGINKNRKITSGNSGSAHALEDSLNKKNHRHHWRN